MLSKQDNNTKNCTAEDTSNRQVPLRKNALGAMSLATVEAVVVMLVVVFVIVVVTVVVLRVAVVVVVDVTVVGHGLYGCSPQNRHWMCTPSALQPIWPKVQDGSQVKGVSGSAGQAHSPNAAGLVVTGIVVVVRAAAAASLAPWHMPSPVGTEPFHAAATASARRAMEPGSQSSTGLKQ